MVLVGKVSCPQGQTHVPNPGFRVAPRPVLIDGTTLESGLSAAAELVGLPNAGRHNTLAGIPSGFLAAFPHALRPRAVPRTAPSDASHEVAGLAWRPRARPPSIRKARRSGRSRRGRPGARRPRKDRRHVEGRGAVLSGALFSPSLTECKTLLQAPALQRQAAPADPRPTLTPSHP